MMKKIGSNCKLDGKKRKQLKSLSCVSIFLGIMSNWKKIDNCDKIIRENDCILIIHLVM